MYRGSKIQRLIPESRVKELLLKILVLGIELGERKAKTGLLALKEDIVNKFYEENLK